MQNGATNQLHIVVNHVPVHQASGGHPAGFEDRLVSFDGDIVFYHPQFAVKRGSGRGKFFIFLQTPTGLFYSSECFREDLF